jgi:hypothetical protein
LPLLEDEDGRSGRTQANYQRGPFFKEARSKVERLDATKHEWSREPSDEDIIEQLELCQRSKGDLVYKTCERAAEPQPVAWQEYIEQRLAQEREHVIALLGEVIDASWRRQVLEEEIRALRIEVANFSTELSELRAIMSAERSGKVIDLPVSQRRAN